MRMSILIAASAALFAVPAAADVVHTATVPHGAQTVSVSYEPQVKTTLRQTGLGPRVAAGCLWKSEVSAVRKLSDAAGRPVAALTRTVGKAEVSEGIHAGYCHQLSAWQTAAFAGDDSKTRAFLAQTAESDRHGLHVELASLNSLGHGVSR